MTDDKKIKKEDDINEKAGEMVDIALPVDMTYSEIMERNILEFIYEQYDEKQREEILATLKRDKDGSIMWKGEKGDYIKLKYEGDRLVKGVLKDKHRLKEYEKVSFKVKDDGYIYKEYNKAGVDVEKNKVKVKERKDKDKWLTVSMRSSESKKYDIEKFVKKAKVVLNDREEVVEMKKSTSFLDKESILGVTYGKESQEYRVDDKTGNTFLNKKNSEVLFSPVLGVITDKDIERTITDRDGNSVSNRTKVGGNVGIFGVGAGVEAERTETDKEGNSQTKGFGISGGVGYFGINGKVSGKSGEVIAADDNGKTYEESSSFEIGGSLGRKGAGIYFKTDDRIKDVDGSEDISSMEVEAKSNILGIGVRHKASSYYKGENGEKIVESEKGVYISPLITENRVVDKQKGEIDDKKFDKGFDLGVKDNTLKRVDRVVNNKGDIRDLLGLVSEGVGVVSKELSGFYEDRIKYADKVYEAGGKKGLEGTVFDENKNEEVKTTDAQVMLPNGEEVAETEVKSKETLLEKEEKTVSIQMSEQERSDIKGDLRTQAEQIGTESILPKISEQERKEIKEQMKAQSLQKETIDIKNNINGAENLGEGLPLMEINAIENINKFDTKLKTREIIRDYEKNNKKQQYNNVATKKMYELRIL